MNFIESLRWRYAVKQFDPNAVVSESDLQTILEAGNLAATSYGLQPYQFVVVADQNVQDQLVEHSYNQPQVAQASHLIVLAARTNVDADYITNSARETEQIRGLEPGTLDAYAKQMVSGIMMMSDEKRLQWAQKQIYIVLGNLLTACAMLQVDSCPMEGFVPQEYNRLLGLDQRNLHATVVLPIGYRSADDKQGKLAKVRKTLDQMVVRLP